MAYSYTSEAAFEKDVINLLKDRGWTDGVLEYPSEEDLLDNWKSILFKNNDGVDRLNGCRLTDGEMGQILEQIAELRSPYLLNGWINGRSVAIKRDNEDDKLHFGGTVSLKIYDRKEIAGGESTYQIAQQPQCKARDKWRRDMRGDLELLINGMPVIHIELKNSGVSVSRAEYQIQRYYHDAAFTGIFSLVQVFVAMEPNEAVYYANPGSEEGLDPGSDYFFHWADRDNEPINDWKRFTKSLLNIPRAHQLIGFYTVPDASDDTLKVMRSYQLYAAESISDAVAKSNWTVNDSRGGYVWHTTGSGKTMTSFKSAQLVAESNHADKVVFLVDRRELDTQSLRAYRNFAGSDLTDEQRDSAVQQTQDSAVLVSKLRSDVANDRLIVTTIEKMGLVQEAAENAADIAAIRKKRVVFIVDECHRSTFGKMMYNIKHTFPTAMLFGFTGTPIFDENNRQDCTTSDVFGNELHHYTIADGIRDKNVLGFDPVMCLTYKDDDLRRAVAFDQVHSTEITEIQADPSVLKRYNHFMYDLDMADKDLSDGTVEYGIEHYVPPSQYERPEHRETVVDDILENWSISHPGGLFHGMLSANHISEAIEYYRIFKSRGCGLKVTVQVDPNLDNGGGDIFKEDGLVEVLKDYDARYNQNFTLSTYQAFKRDVALRLAHKDQYAQVHKTPDQEIDLLIVVDQMLTGFDSKWVNTLYFDRVKKNEAIIQSFSRTNRLFGPQKPFGNIRYYRKCHTMEKNIDNAFRLFSGDRPRGLFVDKLPDNIKAMNAIYEQIRIVFSRGGEPDFTHLPDGDEAKAKFAKLFHDYNEVFAAAKIQGFAWDVAEYPGGESMMSSTLDEQTYLVLVLRYKELFGTHGNGEGNNEDVPYDIDPYLTQINTDRIDADYMQSRFKKWLGLKQMSDEDKKAIDEALVDLHTSYKFLTAEEQEYAELFLHDVERGVVTVDPSKTFRDYITKYMAHASSERVDSIVDATGVDKGLLVNLIAKGVTGATLDEYGQFNRLLKTVDKERARAFFSSHAGREISAFQANLSTNDMLRKFVLDDSFDAETYVKHSLGI